MRSTPRPFLTLQRRYDGSWGEGHHCMEVQCRTRRNFANSHRLQLSGGQRARVALARAVYARADM